MGEVADDMVNGACCSQCGEYFERANGYPVLCSACMKSIPAKDKKNYQESTEKTL